MTKKAEPKIAEAAGAASNKKTVGSSQSIEEAMSKAAAEAQAEGIIDPNEIRERMLAARKRVADEI